MDTTVKITDLQAPHYITFLKSEQERISRLIDSLNQQIQELNRSYRENEATLSKLNSHFYTTLNGLKKDPSEEYIVRASKLSQQKKTYSSELTWFDKVSYILNYQEKVFSAKEIFAFVIELEPELKQASDSVIEKVKNNVFAILTNKSKEGIFIRYKENGEYKYGLKQWLDKDGKVRKEFTI